MSGLFGKTEDALASSINLRLLRQNVISSNVANAETPGYKAKKMTHFLTYYPSVGYNQEAIHCFVASGLTKSKTHLDTDEFITVKKMDLKKFINMIKKNKIIDSKTICTVMVYAAQKKLF